MNTGNDDTHRASSSTAEERDIPPPVEGAIDLDALRGWKERRDPQLQMAHRLPVLAELVEVSDAGAAKRRFSLHGPELLLGRFQSQYAPVDLTFPGLQDHRAYRLGAPHAHLSWEEQQWRFQPLSPHCETQINGKFCSHLHEAQTLEDGALLQLGATRFRFQTGGVTVEQWRQAQRELLASVDEAALFLKRRGGICGPVMRLDDLPLLLGRTHPAPGILPKTDEWPETDESCWDLSGLYDYERRHVAFRHAMVYRERGQWSIRPLSTRQRTFINRIALSGPAPLRGGDEVGLGCVLFHFHDPEQGQGEDSRQHVPTVVDWSEGRAPSAPKPEGD